MEKQREAFGAPRCLFTTSESAFGLRLADFADEFGCGFYGGNGVVQKLAPVEAARDFIDLLLVQCLHDFSDPD
jgi:hypothetical protein